MDDEHEMIELDEDEQENVGTLDEFMEEQKRAAEAMKLPQAPIDRIIKEQLPSGMHASKETRAILSRAVSVFIICLGTAAHDSAVSAKRKGIVEKDVFEALKKMHLNIPEITTLLKNFKTNMERQKETKGVDSSTINGMNVEETITEDTIVDDTMENQNVEASEMNENMDDQNTAYSLSTLPR